MSGAPTLAAFFPRDLYISKEKRVIYDRLTTDSISPLEGEPMATVFVYAAVFGFQNDQKRKLKTRELSITSSAITDVQKAVLLSLVISDNGDTDVLLDSKGTIEAICQYANGGIDILEKKLIKGGADPIIQMSADLNEIFQKILDADSSSDSP